MLYDNALLGKVYLEAWQATGRDLYRRVAAEIFDYVLRDMTDRRGGFHSAEDADSEGEEGKFYAWRPEEIEALLGEEDGALFCDYYGVTPDGNFEGHSILNVRQDPATFLGGKGIDAKDWEARIAPLRRKLLAQRSKRIRPGRDDKVLAAWNGMMISALARGYQVLGDRRYRAAAERAADFVLTEMVRDGMLLRTYRGMGAEDTDGVSKLPAYLEDYAELAAALVDLYEATFDRRWLEAADELVERMVADFWDEQHGGFFFTSADHKNLLVRTKPFHDGPIPSGNATATLVLLRLSKLLGNEEYLGKAEKILAPMRDEMRTQPRAHLNLLCAADFYLGSVREIALAGRYDSSDTGELLDAVHRRFIPNKVLALIEPAAADAEATQALIPLLAGKRMISGKATAYVCENYACKQPVSDAASLEELLDNK